MKRLAFIILLAATSANAQDHAMTADEYWHTVEVAPETLEAHVPEGPTPSERPECVALAKKAKRGLFWKSIAVGFAYGLANTSTAHYRTNINGQTYSSSITYTDPYKLARSRAAAASTVSNLQSATERNFLSNDCGDLHAINY